MFAGNLTSDSVAPEETTARPSASTAASIDVAMNAGEEPVVPEAFSVHDHGSANWVVRKIIEARSYSHQVEQWAAAEIKRAQSDEAFFLFRFGRQLENWARGEIAQLNGRRKSINLPAGTIGFRTESPRLIVKDDNQLLKWCRKALSQAIKVSVEASGEDAVDLREWQAVHCPDAHVIEQVAKGVVNDHVKDTGEIPDGVDRVEGGERFYVK